MRSFAAGNKRSGSTLMVRLLNLHPEVLVTHEADTSWIVYQMVKQMNFEGYPLDGNGRMRITLK